MPTNSPLQSFFRKAKLQLHLPSQGRWYPKDGLELNPDGSLDVFSMTAGDDVKFRASKATVSGTSTFDLIKSCIPGIKFPEQIPSIDLDHILLAIRKASYGDNLTIEVNVPGTKPVMKRKLQLSVQELLKDRPAANVWEENLIIENTTTGEKLELILKPNTIKSIFDLTKKVSLQNQAAIKVAENADLTDEVKLNSLDSTVLGLSDIKIKIIIDGISEAILGEYKTDKPDEIEQLIRNIDYDYYVAIEKHLKDQRAKFNFKTIPCISTQEEIAAGAPQTWNAELTFVESDYFRDDQ